MPMPSARNVRNNVSSRPMKSETQPKRGRLRPFMRLLIERANVSAGIVKPRRVTGVCAIPKPLAIGASCAVAMRPLAATSTKSMYKNQKTALRSVCSGLLSNLDCNARGFQRRAAVLLGGFLSANAAKRTTKPWMSANLKKVASYPREARERVKGMMVTAAPAPKPAAVTPAARPRRLSNHFTTFPMHVPYTSPVPIPPMIPPVYREAKVLARE